MLEEVNGRAGTTRTLLQQSMAALEEVLSDEWAAIVKTGLQISDAGWTNLIRTWRHQWNENEQCYEPRTVEVQGACAAASGARTQLTRTSMNRCGGPPPPQLSPCALGGRVRAWVRIEMPKIPHKDRVKNFLEERFF